MLHNSRACCGSRITIFVPAFLSVIGRFLWCPSLIGCKTNPVKCTVQYIVHVIGGFRYDILGPVFSFKIAASEPQKRVTGRIFRISK